MPRFTYTLVLLSSLFLFATSAASAQDSMIIRPPIDTTDAGYYRFEVLKRPQIGLVLSGGGARGATQIGVLKVLERHNIPVDFIAATSMGAIVGGLYASGYSTAEIESLALNTNWEDVLSLTEDTKRTELFVDQKLQEDRSFLVVRFEGLEPVIPSAISSGQRLTDYLSTHTFQAIYQPHPSFDDLKVRFRAVTTDLISGRRVIIDRGSLAEALRASATVPMVFTPLKRDSMQLIDGGLVSNIPVDVARKEGLDIVIAVNSTSGLRNADELKAPWQTADQIMGIMMQQPNEAALKEADIVIRPRMGKHLSSDFKGLDSLIIHGEEAAEAAIPQILALMREKSSLDDSMAWEKLDLSSAQIRMDGGGESDSTLLMLLPDATQGTLTLDSVNAALRRIVATGDYHNVCAQTIPGEIPVGASNHHSQVVVRFHAERNPIVDFVAIAGTRVMPLARLLPLTMASVGVPLNHERITRMTEEMIRIYRKEGFSLARVESVAYDPFARTLLVHINEGVIEKIEVEGGIRAKDAFVLREFPLREGDVFQIDEANKGITNISSTTLFEYVYLEVDYARHNPVLTIRLKERPSQLVRFGMRADDERNLQGSIDVRDENFQGLGTELGLNINGGARNREGTLEFKAHRLFDTYFTFNISAFYSLWDDYFYGDDPAAGHNRWDRQKLGEYRDERVGGRVTFGTQLEKFGNATVDYTLQEVWMKNKENAEVLRDRFRLSTVRVGTVIDSKDSYPFPRTGFGANISYEFSFQSLGSQVGFNVVRFRYESFSTWGNRHTLHPRFTLGFADRTMPLAEQFRLGGRESMFGTREADRRGRQLFLFNLEYRYFLPVRLLFESYVRVRFDMGSISEMPEELKLATVRYGIGTELALDTPIGPAAIGVGKSFYFGRDLPANPFLQGPFLVYFAMGYQL